MENKRDRSAYGREHYLRNRKRLRAEQARYYDDNKSKLKEDHKKYYKNNKERILHERSTSTKGRYRNYLYNAKTRGYSFELTYDEFITYWNVSCHYCGASIETIGLDRLNNDLGYIKGNVVACCTSCNKAKLEMTATQYITLCKKVASKH
jgi:hypothetical protein